LVSFDDWNGGELGYSQYSASIFDTSNPFLEITFDFQWGIGENLSIDSSLGRPFQKLVENSKLPGHMTYVFHTADDERFHVLGSLSITPGNKILFFPGMIDRKIDTYNGKKIILKKNTINHFTLNSDHKKWHVTVDKKNHLDQKIPSFKTKKIDTKNRSWFVLRVRDISNLELMPKKQKIQLYGDINRLKKIESFIQESRNDAIYQSTKLDDDSILTDFFWQFEFFVSLSKNRDDFPTNSITARKMSGTTINDTRTQAHARTHQILLKGFDGSIFIRVSKILGTMSTPSVFFSES